MGSHFLNRPSKKMFKYILTISLLVTAIFAKPRARKLARSEGSSSWERPSSWDDFSSGDWPSSWDDFSSGDMPSSWDMGSWESGYESPAGSWSMGSGSHHEESSSSWEWPSSWDDFSSGDFSSGDSYGSWESGSSSSWDSMGSWESGSWESGSGSPAGR